MRNRLFVLLAGAAIFAGACGGAASPSPAASGSAPAGSTAPSGSAAPGSGEPSGSAAPSGGGEFDAATLFESDYAPEEGTPGGTLIIGDWQEGGAQNPWYVGQVTFANVASAAFQSLITFSHDFKFVVQDAVEVPTLDNGGVVLEGEGMVVTWQLRDDLKWSDGEAVTCEDYKYAWEWTMNEENVAVSKVGHENITEFECASDTEMVLTFDRVHEGYITMFSSPLRRDYHEDIPFADQLAGAGYTPEIVADIPTNGPFKFASQTAAQDLRLVRNENWTSPDGRQAYLDELIFKWYGDVPSMLAGYESGEIDGAFDLQDSDIPAVEAAGLTDELSAVPALTYEFLRPNHGAERCSRNPQVTDRGEGCPMADPAMREALKLAVDKERINEQLLGGDTVIANSNVSPSAWFYAETEGSTQDLDAARQALEDAGWVEGDDGIREKDGLRAKIELCTTTRQVRQDTLALIAGWLREIGVEAIVNPVDATTAIFAVYGESTDDTPCNLAHNNFDVAEHAYTSSPDPLGQYFNYHSSQFRPEGQNEAQIDDPEVDEALDTVRYSVDFAEVKTAMADFQRIYVEKTLEIPLYYRLNVELASPAIGNFFANGTQAGSTWNAGDWFRKEQ